MIEITRRRRINKSGQHAAVLPMACLKRATAAAAAAATAIDAAAATADDDAEVVVCY